jgi:hypothetical protein
VKCIPRLDGSRVAYSIVDGQNTMLYVVSTMGGIPKKGLRTIAMPCPGALMEGEFRFHL